MSAWLIAFVGVIYAYIAAEQWWSFGNIPMAITFAGYSFSNIGLFMGASK